MVRQYGETAGPIRVPLLAGNAPFGMPIAGGREVDEEKIPPVLCAKESQIVPNLVLPVADVRFVLAVARRSTGAPDRRKIGRLHGGSRTGRRQFDLEGR